LAALANDASLGGSHQEGGPALSDATPARAIRTPASLVYRNGNVAFPIIGVETVAYCEGEEQAPALTEAVEKIVHFVAASFTTFSVHKTGKLKNASESP
jgi:hypothetical protein